MQNFTGINNNRAKIVVFLELYNVLIREAGDAWLLQGRLFPDHFIDFVNFIDKNRNSIRLVWRETLFERFSPADCLRQSGNTTWSEFLHQDLDFTSHIMEFSEFCEMNPSEYIRKFVYLLKLVEWYPYTHNIINMKKYIDDEKLVVLSSSFLSKEHTELSNAGAHLLVVRNSTSHNLSMVIAELTKLLKEGQGNVEEVCEPA